MSENRDSLSIVREDNYIDLSLIANRIIRNKKFISYFGLGSFIFGLVLSFTFQKSWQGQFQIVISAPEEKGALSDLGLDPGTMVGKTILGNKKKNLETEVEILRSPSVLLDIFNYVKEEKIKRDKSFKKFRYED